MESSSGKTLPAYLITDYGYDFERCSQLAQATGTLARCKPKFNADSYEQLALGTWF